MRNKSSGQCFFVYFIMFVVCVLLLTGIFYFFIDLSEKELIIESVPNSYEKSWAIIKNNLRNFLGYVVEMLLYPFFIFLDLVITSWSIAVSLRAQGGIETIRHLIFHGVIEVPNVALYTYLTFQAFVKVCRDKKFGIVEYVKYLYDRKKIYALSVLLIIVGGFVEGMIS